MISLYHIEFSMLFMINTIMELSYERFNFRGSRFYTWYHSNLFFRFFLWLILRVAYTGLTGKYQYAGDIFDISMLFLCILVVHFIIN